MKCIRAGHRCPGYIDQTRQRFHHSFAYTYQTGNGSESSLSRIDSPAILEMRPSLSAPDSASSEAYGSERSGASDLVLVPQGLPASRDEHALPLLLSMFSAEVSTLRSYSFMYFLPNLLQKSGNESALRLASKAVAYAYLANKENTIESGHTRAKTYIEALKVINSTLQAEPTSPSDELMVSVWLLGIYEVVTGHSSFSRGPISWTMHIRGLLSLLRLRGFKSTRTAEGCNIFFTINTNIQIMCLTANVDCPSEAETWLKFIYARLPKRNRDFHRVSTFAHRASAVNAKLRRIADGELVHNEQLVQETLNESELLEAEVTSWLASDPLSPGLLRQAYFRNWCRAYRFKVQQNKLDLLNMLEMAARDVESQYQASRGLLRYLADETLSTLSAILGPAYLSTQWTPDHSCPSLVEPSDRATTWGDALRLTWPLRLIAASTSVTADQRREAQAALTHIGQGMHIKQMLSSYYTTETQDEVEQMTRKVKEDAVAATDPSIHL